MVALGGAAAGLAVTVYFSFWAVLALKQQRRYAGKGLIARLLTAVMPAGIPAMGTSRMNFCGAGPHVFGTIMKSQGVQGPVELLETARELGVRIVVCPVSMEMMGIIKEELVPGVELGGVASFVESASRSKVSLVF
jgi:peroxiredoxin family protein